MNISFLSGSDPDARDKGGRWFGETAPKSGQRAATNRAPIGDRKAPWWNGNRAYKHRCSGLGRCRRIHPHEEKSVAVHRDC